MLLRTAAMRVFRRGSVRYVLLTVAVLCLVLYMYFVNSGTPSSLGVTRSSSPNSAKGDSSAVGGGGVANPIVAAQPPGAPAVDIPAHGHAAAAAASDDAAGETNDIAAYAEASSRATCPQLGTAKVDIATDKVYGKLNFNPRYKEYWDDNFERRYLKRRNKWNKLPLKVFVVPHSHNDPGWLKTFDAYFDAQTSDILNNMVDKLVRLPNMTFIWSEISLFAKWWQGAHPQKRAAVKELLQSGRLEITTGGWVMTDEATVHLYAMLDQLVEGHHWVRTNLDYAPRSGWSVDPFGHGATVPYLLRESGVDAMVIQRIHFAWKQHLAESQSGDFVWRQVWDGDGKGDTDILCHNAPFDIYSIKHSCGPHPLVCLTFDFRKIKGEFTEYSQRSQPITTWNLKERAETLIAQYGRTASLYPHNVALVALGDDFRFDHEIEWEQQYSNYQMLFNYINANSKELKAEARFGTVSDYFDAVRERMGGKGNEASNFPKLSGDFFVYSDVFVEGRPAYWSGYYTTRPYWKALSRELEAALRGAEILYSFALARARQEGLNRTRQILERDYEGLTLARGFLGLFQHHDAITGTSKSHVMHDYGLKLFDGLQAAQNVQTHATQYLLTEHPAETEIENEKSLKHWPAFLALPHERSGFQVLPQRLPVYVPPNGDVRIVVYNSLAQGSQEAVRVVITHTNVKVVDSDDKPMPFQLNPVWNASAGPFQIVRDQYELLFLAELPPLSVVTYRIARVKVRDSSTVASVILYNGGLGVDEHSPVFPIQKEQMAAEDVHLESPHLTAAFSRETGLLDSVSLKAGGRTIRSQLQFQAYVSAQFHSGAYLFMPEPRQPIRNISDNAPYFSVLRGAVASEVTILYPDFLLHTVRVYHTVGPLGRALQMVNVVDFPTPPKFRETELFMRILSDINSGNTFYSDLNGFQMLRRGTMPKIGIEGNYYPATTQAYVQDEHARLSLVISHAAGVASWQSGWLEAMLDRRTLYDDSRGMGEGVIDNKRTLSSFWLVIEERNSHNEDYSRPTLLANALSNSLNYPPTVMVVDQRNSPQLRRKVNLINRAFPCDMHVINLRVLPVQAYFEFPSHSSLLLLHRQGYSCDYSGQLNNNAQKSGRANDNNSKSVNPNLRCPLNGAALLDGTKLREAQVASVQRTSLTAMQSMETLDGLLRDITVEPMKIGAYNVTFA